MRIPHPSKKIRVLIAVIIICIGVGALAVHSIFFRSAAQVATSIATGAQDFNDLTTRFQSLAERRGAGFAYDVLRIAALPPNTDVHLLGHAIGDILYKQQGMAGITICTQDFRNACSHAIVIGALQEFGDDALTKIRDVCDKAPGGIGAYTMCFHGLGHGVFAAYQYDLTKTIGFCKKTGTAQYHNREYIECVGGAIMELIGGGGHDEADWLLARKRYLIGPLDPCMSSVIPDDVKEICLTYLTPQIWARAGIDLGNPDPAKFGAAFDLCNAIPTTQQNLRDACFGGFGKEFVPLVGARDIRNVGDFTDEEFTLVDSWCSEAHAPDGRAACIGDAVSSVFWGGENDPHAALRFCSLVQDSAMQLACNERLAGAISTYVTDASTRTKLCAFLPVPLQPHCTRLPQS